MEWMPPPDGIAMCQGADGASTSHIALRKAKRGTPPAGSMSDGSSRMLFANEAPKPQAPKNSVGIFVGINIF
jgi:hypothetical protein